MAIYITQGNFTGESMKSFVATPEDRAAPVAAMIAAAGGKMLQYYFTTGEYDFLIISEGEGLESMLPSLLVAGASGAVTNLTTCEAVTTGQAKSAMEKAGAILASFKAPGKS